MEIFFKGLGKEYSPLYSLVWIGLMRNVTTIISTAVVW